MQAGLGLCCPHMPEDIFAWRGPKCVMPSDSVNVQSTLVISNSKGLAKHFEISIPRHIGVEEVREKK